MLAELLKNSFRLYVQDYSVQGHQHQLSAGCPLIYQGFTCSSYCLQKISSQSRKPLRFTLNWLLWGHVWLQEWQFRTLNYWPGDLEKAATGLLSHWSQPLSQILLEKRWKKLRTVLLKAVRPHIEFMLPITSSVLPFASAPGPHSSHGGPLPGGWSRC